MPHVIVKLYPGRSKEQKKQLASEIVKKVTEIAVCEEKWGICGRRTECGI
jgi:4-oxalocrotonate tautomerase